MVCIDNDFSKTGALKYSISQGSILGPFLFIIYVNVLLQSLSEAGFYLYADDICIFYQDSDVEKLKKILNSFRHYAVIHRE